MAQVNVELVRGVYDAFAHGNVDAVFAAMEPDIEWDESEGMPYGGVYHGRDAIVANVFGPILADVEGFTADPDEILALDDARVIAAVATEAPARAARSTPASCTSGRSPTARCRGTSSLPTRAGSATPSASSPATRRRVSDHTKEQRAGSVAEAPGVPAGSPGAPAASWADG